ncbi:MAG: LysM peptidoglycan-binding domain-containing protein [Chloroflexota bacterium]|nr:LysM peptidoglycan-binding domain-containing protein [Chloroflexota bacterium]
MKKRKYLFIILICVGLCVLVFAVYLLVRHSKTEYSPPLVLIQDPVNKEEVPVGRGVLIHATADDQDGLVEFELWVDDELISRKEVNPDKAVEKLVISAAWMPYPQGEHLIIARAKTVDGDSGQASIIVTAVEQTVEQTPVYVVQPGESLESIAEAHGMTEEEVVELNEGLDPASLEAGDEIDLTGEDSGSSSRPGMEEPPIDWPSEDRELPPDDEEPPLPAFEIDPTWLELLRLLPVEIPAQLKVEVLSLETEGSYDMLHCYSSLAGADPRWVPDVDGDQATDETFSSSGGSGTAWDVAVHFADENAMRFPWPMSDSVPLDISCVGVIEDGTESVNLGRIVDSIEPERWGILQHTFSTGGEAIFRMIYKVSTADKGLDRSITPPWNVRINEEDHTLEWDYLPEERDEIDGFAILLNNTLQWTEYRSAHEASLPSEWFNLPCGDEYGFQVVAFRTAYPEGDYSLPSETAFIRGNEVGGAGCGRSVVITFETLTTGELGRNPSPVYGSFYANDQELRFDGRPIEGDNFPTTFGLSENDTYNISRIMRGFGNNQTQLIVEFPPGRANISELLLWVGFDIYQGGNKVCSGEVSVPEERLAGSFSGAIDTDYPVGRLPDWCIVNFSIQPVEEAPVVEPGAPPPLPDLVVQKLTVDPSSKRVRIHVRNVGQATWSEKNIVAQVSWPDGEEIGTFDWQDVTLAPGETRILSHGGLNPQPALGVCVLLDPNNAVEEVRDRLVTSEILGEKQPYCRPLPDLSITNVIYEEESNDIRIDVQNQGEDPISSSDTGGSLDLANLLVWITFAEGRPLTQRYIDLNLEPRDDVTLIWPLNESERARMRAGYTVIINPDDSIAESDTTNNQYEVEGVARLRISWMVGYAMFCPTGNTLLRGENVGGKNTWDMQLRASVSSGRSTRRVADWNSPEFELTWRDGSGDWWCRAYISDWFEVAGDEVLTITRTAELDIATYGFRWFSGGGEVLTAADDFGGTTHVPPDTSESCFETGVTYVCHGHCACGIITCGWLEDTGVRLLGPFVARSDDIVDYCFWSTTYTIFREDQTSE